MSSAGDEGFREGRRRSGKRRSRFGGASSGTVFRFFHRGLRERLLSDRNLAPLPPPPGVQPALEILLRRLAAHRLEPVPQPASRKHRLIAQRLHEIVAMPLHPADLLLGRQELAPAVRRLRADRRENSAPSPNFPPTAGRPSLAGARRRRTGHPGNAHTRRIAASGSRNVRRNPTTSIRCSPSTPVRKAPLLDQGQARGGTPVFHAQVDRETAAAAGCVPAKSARRAARGDRGG